ncbi:MAG: hypothetical protein LBL35_03415 [Clostridiales bacterium]|jgi:hypothetical protein|nr:hypothetical protein [Clostridiales bacterium]
MKLEVIVQNANGEMFDVSELCVSATYDTHIADQPGRLVVEVMEDPTKAISFANGDVIFMNVGDAGMFYGYIFSMKTEENRTVEITAYDQSRYLKNDDVFATPPMTADVIFENCCRRAGLSKFEAKCRPRYICPEYFHDKKSLYSIIKYGIERTFENEGRRLFVRDDFGSLIFDDVKNQRVDAVIGDASLLYGYKSEISIDRDTFNLARIYKDDETFGKRIAWEAGDKESQKRWGVLSYVKRADKDMNAAQMAELSERILRVKNRETRSLSLQTLGDARFKAGMSFDVGISRLGIRGEFVAESVTHRFYKGEYVMSMGVFSA